MVGGRVIDGVELGTIVWVSVLVRVGVVETNVVGVNVRVGVGDMNPIGVWVGVAEGPARVRVRVGVLLTLGVTEGTAVQVEVMAGSPVDVLDKGNPPPSLDGIGVGVASSPVHPESVTMAVKVAATSVSTCPGATIVPSAGALTVDSAFTVAIRSNVELT